MEIQKNEEKQKNEGKREEQETKHQVQLISPPPSSASSSPSHEFSFTISLHPPPLSPPPADVKNKAKSPPPPPYATAIDLSPADEIFFHGHLLPLHLLSGGGGGHHPAVVVSPRSSTNSLDSFTLPVRELPQKGDGEDDRHGCKSSRHVLEGKERGKSKSFSLWMPRKSRKGCDDDDEGQKRKSSRFDLVKRLVLKPFLSLGRGNQELFLRPPPYGSYSGNLRVKNNKDFMRGRRSSAPVSVRNSPTNSGILVASGNVTPTNKSDSTMEELQAAIQAAIAHCKKSIDAAAEDRVQLQQ